MVKLDNFIYWLAGIRHDYGGRGPDDPTTLALAKLIRKAKQTIRIVSGVLPSGVYDSEKVLSAIKKAVDRQVEIEIIVGPSPDPESFTILKQLPIEILLLPEWPVKHFVIVDGRHVRIEKPHDIGEKHCDQYVIYNYRFTWDLEREYRQVRRNANGRGETNSLKLSQ